MEGLAQRLLQESGTKCEIIVADLADPHGLAEVEKWIAEDERLSLLVNNAGFGGYCPFASIEPSIVDDLIGVHIRATARLTRAALPGMIARAAGAIVNIASLLALSGPLPPTPLPYRATYAGAKAFLLVFTQALASELNGTGVRVQVCLPGRVSTEFHILQGMDVSVLPPAMSADDVAVASLAALEKGEIVCIPTLADPTLIDALMETQVKAFRTAVSQTALAPRYRT
jgi:short-subunit dehydrogenase